MKNYIMNTNWVAVQQVIGELGDSPLKSLIISIANWHDTVAPMVDFNEQYEWSQVTGNVLNLHPQSELAKQVIYALEGSSTKLNKGIDQLLLTGVMAKYGSWLGKDHYILNPSLFFKGEKELHPIALHNWEQLGLPIYGSIEEFGIDPDSWEKRFPNDRLKPKPKSNHATL